MTDEECACPPLHFGEYVLHRRVWFHCLTAACVQAIKGPAGWTSVKRRSRCTKIVLLQPRDSLDYPRRSPPPWHDTIWEMMSTAARRPHQRRKTRQAKKTENPQTGTAVWRGIIENASLSFIRILFQLSQPDLKGFSIKSWTWQVMTIYSTKKMLNKGLLDQSVSRTFQWDNEAILALSFL